MLCEESLTESSENPSDNLKVFEAVNQFQTLSDTSEEDINILNKKKGDLNKCRSCNYKKRKCALKSSNCKAALLHCFLCKKPGHFPKSLYCQKGRK